LRVLARGDAIRIVSMDAIPEEILPDRPALERLGRRSLVVVPLAIAGQLLGTLGLATARVERALPDDVLQRLRVIGEVFANAIARRRADEELRKSEADARLLLAVNNALVSRRELADVVRGILPGMRGVLGCTAIEVVLVEREAGRLEVRTVEPAPEGPRV